MSPALELRLFDPAAGEWLRTHQETEAARLAAEDEIDRLRSELRRLQQQ